MLRTAYSTVACPDWTLEQAARAAAEFGFRGVELRSAGDGGAGAFACDPAFTDPRKVRSIFDEAGVDISGIASGVRFDAPVFPPVLGHVFAARHASVSEAKRMIDLAAKCGAGFVRVFAYQIPGAPAPLVPGDTRWSALRRICARLADVCDHARNRDVRIQIENGGDFASFIDLTKIMDLVASPLLTACYDLSAGTAAGDKPADAVSALGTRISAVRVRDERGGVPCRLGQGEAPVKALIDALNGAGSDAWVTYSWDRAWLPELLGAEQVLPEAARRLNEWCGSSVSSVIAA